MCSRVLTCGILLQVSWRLFQGVDWMEIHEDHRIPSSPYPNFLPSQHRTEHEQKLLNQRPLGSAWIRCGNALRGTTARKANRQRPVAKVVFAAQQAWADRGLEKVQKLVRWELRLLRARVTVLFDLFTSVSPSFWVFQFLEALVESWCIYMMRETSCLNSML